MIDFEKMFFDDPIERTLFYSPKIEIKPAHLANGLFRAICGTYASSLEQHRALYPQAYPESPGLPDYLSNKKNAAARRMLHALLAADGTVFKQPDQSSYTLTHMSHITRDHHDRRTGEWLRMILAHDIGTGTSLAFSTLQELLSQNDRQRSDELSTLTLPLLDQSIISPGRFKAQLTDQMPTSLSIDASGNFVDPLLLDIRNGFDYIALNDQGDVLYGGKLDTLRRLVTWACFSVYIHLANSGRERLSERVPMLLCFSELPTPTLRQASIQSYQWVNRLVDKFLRNQIQAVVEQMAIDDVPGTWDNDALVEERIRTMVWKTARGGMRQKEETQAKFVPDCLSFYRSYRTGTANQPPRTAFSNAMADMLDRVLSSSPGDVARSLGTRIGLLTTVGYRTRRLYKPVPDLLEVLVRASIPPGKSWTLTELAIHWAKCYGVVVGALGDDNGSLGRWGINAVDGAELADNVDALALMLEMSGYARRYADGVVLVSVTGD